MDVYKLSCFLLLYSFSAQHLRQVGVVGKFVEFFGPGVAQLSIADRATIANMCPEYGATAAFFPVDHISIQYLKQTGALTCPGSVLKDSDPFEKEVHLKKLLTL